MFTEGFVSILLEASITGAGLILAIYALISPILDKVIKVRKELIAAKKEQFDILAEKIKTERSDANMKQLNKLNDALTELTSFPNFLGLGVVLVFMLFLSTSVNAFIWFTQPSNAKSLLTEDTITVSFLSAIGGFFIVGLYTILEVARTMRHEWKELEEEKAKAKKSVNEELQKIKTENTGLKIELLEAKHYYGGRGENPKDYWLSFSIEALVRNEGGRATTISDATLRFKLGTKEYETKTVGWNVRIKSNDRTAINPPLSFRSSYTSDEKQERIPFTLVLFETHEEFKLRGASIIIPTLSA
jgi:hypothetical protein